MDMMAAGMMGVMSTHDPYLEIPNCSFRPKAQTKTGWRADLRTQLLQLGAQFMPPLGPSWWIKKKRLRRRHETRKMVKITNSKCLLVEIRYK